MTYKFKLDFRALSLSPEHRSEAKRMGVLDERTNYISVKGEHNFGELTPLAGLLKNAGLRPWIARQRAPLANEFSLSIDREYSEVDLDAAHALWLVGGDVVETPTFTDQGKPFLDFKGAADARKNWDVAIAFPPCVFVREVFAKLLPRIAPEATIVEAEVIRGGDSRWWELNTPCTMPRISESMHVFNAAGGAPSEDFSTGFFVCDWVFSPGELRYEPEALEYIEHAGLARTFEPYGNFNERKPEYCPMLISGKAYRACKAAGIRLTGVPVRSSEDPTPPEELAIRRFWDW